MIPSEKELRFLENYLLSGSSSWSITPDAYRRMRKIIRRYRSSKFIKGRLGEIFTVYNIRNQLRNYGFKWTRKTEPNSFYIEEQYRGKHGVDIYLKLVNHEGTVYRCFIEVYNWMSLHDLNDYLFDKRIKSKFQRWDRKNKYFHIITMNKRNIRLIEDRCEDAGILIIQLPQHVTVDLIRKLEGEGRVGYDTPRGIMSPTMEDSLLEIYKPTCFV